MYFLLCPPVFQVVSRLGDSAFVRSSCLALICGGGEDLVWYLEINAILMSPVKRRLSPRLPDPARVARERRSVAAEFSKPRASKVALPGTGFSVPSPGAEGYAGREGF